MKQCDKKNLEKRRENIIGLGDRSFRKNYYPQLKRNTDRLERFKALLDYTPDMVMLISLPDGKISDVNQAVCQLFGKSTDELVEHPIQDLPWGDNSGLINTLLSVSKSPDNKNSGSVVIDYMKNDGAQIYLELGYQLAKLDQADFCVVIGRDVTELVQQNEKLNSLLIEKNALLDNTLVGMAWVEDRHIISCNQRFEDMLGYEPGAIIGASTEILYDSAETYRMFGSEAYRVMTTEDTYTGSIQLKRADGNTVWCELTGNAIDKQHPHKGSVWIFNDINHLKLSEEKAVFMSQHDNLTGLPNHHLLSDRFDQAKVRADRYHYHIAVMSIDIDNFKTINDLVGYSGANDVLVQISQRLNDCFEELGTVSRQGGDEFIIMIPNLPNTDNSLSRISALFSAIEAPLYIHDQEIVLTHSVGVSFYPDDGTDFEMLLSKADSAMYQAKEDGRNTYRFYRKHMNRSVEDELTVAFGLRRAIEENQLQLYYQPKIEIASGMLMGAEALIRWIHPEKGMISPGKFIPIAETTGLIIPISDWVLKNACEAVARWREMGMPQPLVAVNLSALQFARGNVQESVYQAIKHANIEPGMLELELTESIMIRDPSRVLEVVQTLKDFGCRFSIDDFGTGYSSLAYLKRFPIDILKIDREFIKDVASNSDDEIIVKTIIQMAQSFGMTTVAEGIEDAETLEFLRHLGCDRSQGYYTGRPMPEHEFIEFMLNNKEKMISAGILSERK
ncbi:EAL domain-containing protein [Vibrio sp. CAIM 722]|uniref:cyclic-guanylate-specific phosphodiesterase n=1 Tax=Vibrio eleionomae TaxID=2653505 RepID=A0A7X4LM65_9VIBR|nr:EAL domain-containing protein [Vibrio eleionomae]